MVFLSSLIKNVAGAPNQPKNLETVRVNGEVVPNEIKPNPFASLEFPIIEDFDFFTIATTYKEGDDLYQEGVMRPKSN